MRNAVGVALVLLVASVVPVQAGAVITNGSGIYLGVNDAGHLNFAGAPPALNAGLTGGGVAGSVGVSSNRPSGFPVMNNTGVPAGTPGLYDATSPGCLCEGWGVSVNGTTWGGANESYLGASGGTSNLTVAPFTSTASTATSVVSLTSLPGLTVTHAYAPSSSPSLYQATVTITNGTGSAVSDVRYRRVMDWDVPPTEFNEFVTIAGWPATNLIGTSDNGFDTPNPLAAVAEYGGCGVNLNFTKCHGAAADFDHGALFNFGFGSLAAGDSVKFNIFYGAAANESAILAALGSVGVEVYSLGYSTSPTGGPATDSAVYAFGFSGVGGTPIEPVPEPGTLLLLGSGVTALVARRRRRA